jgi:glycosyltransferase involved in cell wall biosynthesis
MARILHVTPSYFPAVRYGGPIRSIHGLCAALAARGHEVHVFTTSMDGDGNLDVPLDQPVERDHVQVHYFPVPALRRLCWSPAMGRMLRCETAAFDVVHLHSVYLWPTWAGANAARRAGVPYLVCPRGMLMREVIRRRHRRLKTAWIRLIERQTLAHAAGLHVTAELEAVEARALNLRLLETFCIPNGVSWPADPRPLEAGPFAQLPRPYALFLSRISWKKGLDRLIASWQHVPDLTLVIAGNDDENYSASLESLARSCGVAQRIRFVGPVSDEHKWALYREAELFLLPSYSENFGNVVAEAMAMACPVIVTPDVGLSALVRESGAGLVVSNEPSALAQAIWSLHVDPRRREEMGFRGRRAAMEQLSWPAVAARMERVYRRIGAPMRAPMSAARSS